MAVKRLQDKQFLFNTTLLVIIMMIFAIFAVITYLSLYKFAESNAVDAARLSANQLLTTRSIMAQLAPHVTTDETVTPFATAPAVVGRAIGDELGKRYGFYLKQTSRRYRNELNRPNSVESGMLKELEAGKEEVWLRETRDGLDRIRYGKVLKIEPACLRCHGEPHTDVPDDVYASLTALYGDRGFHYKVGDVRGMISVIIPMETFRAESLKLFYHIILVGFVTLIFLLLLLYLHNRYVIRPHIGLLQESREKLYHTAYHDQTTGLQNRFAFNQNIRENVQNRQRAFWLLFIDLDDFKAVNDLYGHEVGDDVLRSVAYRLGIVEEASEVYRMGGDEFIMMVYGRNRANEIEPMLRELIREVCTPIHTHQNTIHVSVSIGAAHYPTHAGTIELLLRHGDLAMYSAKQGGKNNYVVYSDALLARANAIKQMKNDLRRALDHHEFFLRYQPQYDIVQNRIIGAEALLRWNHPEQGVLAPDAFITVAEESGLIVEIGHWVLQEACRQNRAWQDAGYDPIRIAVNITAAQIEDRRFTAELADVAREAHLDTRYLEVEFIERTAISNEGHTINFIKQLNKMHIHAAIDDFGTGYSSLSYISKFPIDKIKIDRMFVERIHEREDNAMIVRSIIAIAKHLKIKVMAEGVETKEELEFLRREGCTLVQGYFFSKPLLPEEFEALLKKA